MKVINLLAFSHVWVYDNDPIIPERAVFKTYDLDDKDKPYICVSSTGENPRHYQDVRPPGDDTCISYIDIIRWNPFLYPQGYSILMSNGMCPSYRYIPLIEENYVYVPIHPIPINIESKDKYLFDIFTGINKTGDNSLLLYKHIYD